MHENYKKDFIENFYKTDIKPMFKDDYASSRAVYCDNDFVYKVFQKKKDVDQFEKFLKSYKGDLQLISCCKSDDTIIFQFNKLPGETVLNLSRNNKFINLNLDQLMKWFKDQCIEIHNTGIRCYNKYDEYKIKNDHYGAGFVFCFCDWTSGNFLYDQNNNQLHLVDLEPSNWIPRNVWYCIVRDHFKSFIKQFNNLEKLDDPSYVSNLEDKIVEELDKEIPLFLD